MLPEVVWNLQLSIHLEQLCREETSRFFSFLVPTSNFIDPVNGKGTKNISFMGKHNKFDRALNLKL